MGLSYVERLPRTAELVIVGGGVVGAATAFFARRAGIHALLLERRRALCTLTTPASTGAFRLQFDNREELDLVRESVDLFGHFAEATEQTDYDLGVRRRGYLWVTTSTERAARQRELVRLQHGWGQTDIEVLSGDETRARFPYVADGVIQARFRAGDGFLDPKALTMGLAAGARVEAAVGCAVTGFRVEGGRLAAVETSLGAVSTRAAVIAAGPFSGIVASAAGLELPVTTVARHKVILPDAPGVPPDAPMTIDDDTGAHWRPALRGAYVLFTDPATPPSPPVEDVAPDHRLAAALLDPSSPVAVARASPFWAEIWGRNATTWLMHSGQYTMTPDHRPLVGDSGIEGLYLNTGYSGHGIMGSPAASRLLVDVMVGRVSTEANPFRPDRTFEERALDVL